MSKTAVGFIVVSCVACLILLDVFLALDKIESNTISAVIWEWCKKTTIVPFGAGLLCGHLFWRK